MIDDSEKEDFENAIREKGYEVDDFEMIENEDPPSGGVIYAVTGTVTIRRKSTSIEKLYRAGHGSSWPTEFSDDLNSGLFE